MRLHRPIVFLFLAVSLSAQTLISLGTSSNCGGLNGGQTCTLTALVTGLSDRSVTWNFSPQVLGSTPGSPSGPNSAGLTTITYRAPSGIAVRQVVLATATAADGTSAGAQITLIATIEIGGGAPSDALKYAFQQAFNRDGFNTKVSLPPIGSVRAFGSGGYVQEFASLADATLRFALVSASLTIGSSGGYAANVVQLPPQLYAYYTSTGANTAGYPLMDAQLCPGFDTANFCHYSLFDRSYALFSYDEPLANGQNFSVSGTFYTKWVAAGGIVSPGRPVSSQSAITARPIGSATTGTTAMAQTFAAGAIYSITLGPNNGRVFAVIQPVYDRYVNESGPLGALGLPTSDLIQVSTGVYRQTFEGGALQYTSGGGDPVLQYPVTSVQISGAAATGTVMLNLGQTLRLTATPVDASGAALADRPVSWSTSNSRVVTVQPSGLTATVTAVGSGSASVTAASQGVTSSRLNFAVIAPCCQIGDGAPATVQQSFQDALARNRITAQMPVQAPAARAGAGYVQMVQSSDPGASGVYMLAKPDQSGTAYVVTGAILMRYQALGGPTGVLGYPASDASLGGTQLFAGGAALAGNPVRIVAGAIFSKWTAVGRETGAAGPPVSEAASFTTFGANSGQMQSFANVVIYAATAGPRAGQAYASGGAILARYQALGGPAGDFGMPVSDEFANGALRQQNFEGGNITWAGGGAAATEQPAPKLPGVVAAPASVSAGGRARLAIFGFPNNSIIRVSMTGQPDFMVTAGAGAYAWDFSVPLTARTATLSIRATDTRSSLSAEGSLAVKGFADNRVQIAKIQGDNQTGMPGATLPLGLRIALLDSSGNPIVGAPVAFQASPGARVSSTGAITDASGQTEVFLRLPAAEGVAAVTADATSIGQAPVTFFARAAAGSLANFPKLPPPAEPAQGSLLTAAAAILRYRQNRGELPAPNGIADPAALDEYLKSWCAVDLKGNQLCDGYLSNGPSAEKIVNLWRAADFTRGVDIQVHPPSVSAAADLVAAGSPALLSLALSRNGAVVGGHFVVATGIAADGAITIYDPNPLFNRANLNDYFAGFTAAGATWKGELRGVADFALRAPGGTRFLVAALSQPPALMQNLTLKIESASGTCGVPFELRNAVDRAANPPAGGPMVSRISVCAGLDASYQIIVGASQPFRAFVTDLAAAGSSLDISGSATASYKASRPQLNLALAPQDVSFTAEGVVNGASFTRGIAPGGIMTIFGSGLSGPETPTTVEVDGVPAIVLSASPFQINAAVPAELAPGMHTLRIRSAYGTAEQPVTIAAVAPAIFEIGHPPAGAILNQDYTLNSPAHPSSRGQVLLIYATGLGAVNRQGQFLVTAEPVTAILNGQELPVAFAGLTFEHPGLYQVNVLVPAATPPDIASMITLKQGGVLSNTVGAAIQ